jgi:hypothetical protein
MARRLTEELSKVHRFGLLGQVHPSRQDYRVLLVIGRRQPARDWCRFAVRKAHAQTASDSGKHLTPTAST